MFWTIEGKISEWTFDAEGATIKFRIKGTNDNQVKTQGEICNVLVEVISATLRVSATPRRRLKALCLDQNQQFTNTKIGCLPIFTSCQDHVITFIFEEIIDTGNMKKEFWA